MHCHRTPLHTCSAPRTTHIPSHQQVLEVITPCQMDLVVVEVVEGRVLVQRHQHLDHADPPMEVQAGVAGEEERAVRW